MVLPPELILALFALIAAAVGLLVIRHEHSKLDRDE